MRSLKEIMEPCSYCAYTRLVWIVQHFEYSNGYYSIRMHFDPNLKFSVFRSIWGEWISKLRSNTIRSFGFVRQAAVPLTSGLHLEYILRQVKLHSERCRSHLYAHTSVKVVEAPVSLFQTMKHNLFGYHVARVQWAGVDCSLRLNIQSVKWHGQCVHGCQPNIELF